MSEAPTHTVEAHYEIWQDKTGDCIKIGPDRDGLDLVEIKKVLRDGKLEASMILTKEEARLLMRILKKVVQSS